MLQYIYIYSLYPEQDAAQGQFSAFSQLPYYLSIARGRIVGFIPFLGALALCEIKTALSRIWDRVAVSISFDDNHYATNTSLSLPFY